MSPKRDLEVRRARIEVRIGEYLQDTNWNQEASQIVARIFENVKKSEIFRISELWKEKR
ncbi:hypothetical protein MAL04_20650 (plasmid) [Leptospira noguchii]|nr:hypothetical protein MAL04_20650 [Leptospira noguchii]